MSKNQREDTYQSQGQSLQLPPSFRFPPLREGNRRVLVPPACRGNLKEGVFKKCRATSAAGEGCRGARRAAPLRLISKGQGEGGFLWTPIAEVEQYNQ